MDHWRRGHKQMCKKIHRGGNAEQYNADKKYKEAVAVAVEACAEHRADGLRAPVAVAAGPGRGGRGLETISISFIVVASAASRRWVYRRARPDCCRLNSFVPGRSRAFQSA